MVIKSFQHKLFRLFPLARNGKARLFRRSIIWFFSLELPVHFHEKNISKQMPNQLFAFSKKFHQPIELLSYPRTLRRDLHRTTLKPELKACRNLPLPGTENPNWKWRSDCFPSWVISTIWY